MPLNVFICYKKVLTQERNGRIVEQQDQRPGILQYHLKNAKRQFGEYDAFIDEADLVGGMIWESEIYRNILRADAMVVVIGARYLQVGVGKAGSRAGERFGNYGYTAWGGLTTEEMAGEMKELGIERFQWKITHNLKLNAGDALVQELQPLLYRAAEQTKRQQSVTLRELFDRRNVWPAKAPTISAPPCSASSATSRSSSSASPAAIFRDFRGIDVLVTLKTTTCRWRAFLKAERCRPYCDSTARCNKAAGLRIRFKRNSTGNYKGDGARLRQVRFLLPAPAGRRVGCRVFSRRVMSYTSRRSRPAAIGGHGCALQTSGSD